MKLDCVLNHDIITRNASDFSFLLLPILEGTLYNLSINVTIKFLNNIFCSSYIYLNTIVSNLLLLRV